jgi:uncharacterized protein YndB with AHSA1/START domain
LTQVIETFVIIKAPRSEVWRALTDPDWMRQWMAEPEVGIEISTDWRVGTPIVIKGFHHDIHFENKGAVLQSPIFPTNRY